MNFMFIHSPASEVFAIILYQRRTGFKQTTRVCLLVVSTWVCFDALMQTIRSVM